MSEVLDPAPEAGDVPRLRFTASDVRRMLEAGILDDEQRYEVLDGEIVPVQAHNPPHIRVKRWLLNEITLRLGRTCWIDSEPSFYLEDDGDFALPDIIVYPRHIEGHLLRGPDALLVIEVADTSLRKDRGRKARTYGSFGVREYWVANARTCETYVFTGLAHGKYAPERKVDPAQLLSPALLPELSLRLSDIEG